MVRSPSKSRQGPPKGGKRGKRRGAGPAPTHGTGGLRSPRGVRPPRRRARGVRTPRQHLPCRPPLPSPSRAPAGSPVPKLRSTPSAESAEQPHSQLVQHPLHFLIDTHGRGLVLLFLFRFSGGIALRQRGVFVADLLALPLPPHRGWDLNGRQVQRLQKRGRVRGGEQVVGRKMEGKGMAEGQKGREREKDRKTERKEGRKAREKERDGLIMIRLKMVQWIKHGFSIF